MLPLLTLSFIAVIIATIVMTIIGLYKKVPFGKAVIRNGLGGTKIAFENGIFVIPEIHTLQEIDLTIKEFPINLEHKEAITSKDGFRLAFKGKFYLNINPEPQDIYRVAQLIGLEQINDQVRLQELLEDKLKEALYNAAKVLDASTITQNSQSLKDKVNDELGMEVLGFNLEDLVIIELEELNNIESQEGIPLKTFFQEKKTRRD